MAVTSGFFDAKLNEFEELDRKYGSEQFGSLFDGVITDGVFKNYKDALKLEVAPLTSNGLGIYVDPGRAWYDRTWTLNTAQERLNVINPDVSFWRRDAVVLRIDKRLNNVSGRQNKIYIKKGRTDYTLAGTKLTADVLERSSDGDVIEYLIGIIEVTPTATPTPSALKVISTILDPDDKVANHTDISNAGATDDMVAHYCKAIVPTSATVEGIIKTLENEFNSYQKNYKDEFDAWFDEIKDSLGSLSNDQVMQMAIMIGEIYSSNYVSGAYPYVVDEKLYLSPDDTGAKPEVNINFGYASLPFAANARAKEIEIKSTKIMYNSSFTYSVGDYVYHTESGNDILYVCIVDITVPEAWNSNHWQLAE